MTLASEVADDPLGRGYDRMSDEQLIASLNNPYLEVTQDIDVDKFHSERLKAGRGLSETLTAADKSMAAAMGKRKISRAATLGFGFVTPRTLKLQSVR